MGQLVEKLVEYRTVRHSAASEASNYFTNDTANVRLRFNNPIFCQMVSGRKIMRVDESAPFEFLPGEAMFVTPGKSLDIQFPDADEKNSVECLCIEIDRGTVDELVGRINTRRRVAGARSDLVLDWQAFALFKHAPQLRLQVAKLFALYDDPFSEFRDARIDLAHEELLLLILQTQEREILTKRSGTIPDTGLDAAVAGLISDPMRRWSSADLAGIACMSQATFFRHFKARFGMTPSQFANDVRIARAREALAHQSVAEVAHELGFADSSHFSRLYRQTTGETPSETRQRQRATTTQKLRL